jgi:predicted DNA-binding helix-hairpin-helix protein
VDPKLSYALRHPHMFPIDLNKADYETILRVPGIGVKSAQMIVAARRFGRITSSKLQKMGVVLKRAQYFITCGELVANTINELTPELLKRKLLSPRIQKIAANEANKQLSLFTEEHF